MANSQHVEIVRAGVPAIKAWRGESLREGLDLSGADLQGLSIPGAVLYGTYNKYSKEQTEIILYDQEQPKVGRYRTDLNSANLEQANFSDVFLVGCDMDSVRASSARFAGANFQDGSLNFGDFRWASFKGAVLGNANMRFSNCFQVDLRDADLRDADLKGSDFSMADLRGADLRGANFEFTCLRKAKLDGVMVSWVSHELVSELLYRASFSDTDHGEPDPEKLKIAGLVLVAKRTGWCWDKFLELGDPLTEWALDVLRGYVVDEGKEGRGWDGSPAELRNSQ